MANLHGFPDTVKEIQSLAFDLLPACIVATGGLTTPGSGLTLPSVSAYGYVRRGTDLLYVGQPGHAVPVSSTAGTHWLALTADTWTAIAGWTRIAGTHFVEQAGATQPAAPDGAQLVAQIVVTGANITAVTELLSPPLSRQNANNVSITGGTATLTGMLTASGGITATNFAGGSGTFSGTLTAASTTINGALDVVSTSRFQGAVGIGVVPNPSFCLVTNPGNAIFGGNVGVQGINPTTAGLTASTCLITTINCNGTAAKPSGGPWDTYTSSATLKQDIADLTGALATLLRLRGRTWRWRPEQTDLERLLPGPQVGFVTEEVHAALPQWALTAEDGTPGYREAGITALLVESLREIVRRLEALEALA